MRVFIITNWYKTGLMDVDAEKSGDGVIYFNKFYPPGEYYESSTAAKKVLISRLLKRKDAVEKELQKLIALERIYTEEKYAQRL